MNFVRRHARFRAAELRQSISMPVPPREAISVVEQVSPAAPCPESPRPRRLHRFRGRLKQQLLHEGIADLNVRAVSVIHREFGGGEQRGAVNSIAPFFGANVDHGIAGPRALGGKNKSSFLAIPKRQARSPADFASNKAQSQTSPPTVGTPKAISVVRNPSESHPSRMRRFFGRLPVSLTPLPAITGQIAGIEHRHGPRAHGENVAQKSRDAGSRATPQHDGIDKQSPMHTAHFRGLPPKQLWPAGGQKPLSDGRLSRYDLHIEQCFSAPLPASAGFLRDIFTWAHGPWRCSIPCDFGRLSPARGVSEQEAAKNRRILDGVIRAGLRTTEIALACRRWAAKSALSLVTRKIRW